MNFKKDIRLLWVDDEQDFLEVGKELFYDINSNIHIDIANCVTDAFDLLSKINFDIIISDFKMGEMNGLQFIKKLRSTNFFQPFIMFTGQGGEEIAMKALNFGVDYYIMKTFDIKKNLIEINNMINRIISFKQTKKALRREKIKYYELLSTYQHIMNNLSEGVALESPDGKMIYSNPKMLQVFGYSEEEMINKHWTELIDEKDIEKVQKETNKRPKGLSSLYKVTAKKKNGIRFDIVIKGTPIFSQLDNEYVGVLVVFIDKEFHDELGKLMLE